MTSYVLNERGIAFQRMIQDKVLRFGCDDGKARGRSLSPQRRNELEKKSPGSTCTVKTKKGEPRYYRQNKGTMRQKGAEKAKEQGREIVDRDKERYVGRPLSSGSVMETVQKHGLGALAFVIGNDGRVQAYRRKKPLTLEDVKPKAEPKPKPKAEKKGKLTSESVTSAISAWEDRKGAPPSPYNLAKELGVDISDKRGLGALESVLKSMKSEGLISIGNGEVKSLVSEKKPDEVKPEVETSSKKSVGGKMTPGQVTVATRDAINSLSDVVSERGFISLGELFRKARSKNPNYTREDMKGEISSQADKGEFDLYTINSIIDADDEKSVIETTRGVMYYVKPRWDTEKDSKLGELEEKHGYKAGPEGEFVDESETEVISKDTNEGIGEVSEKSVFGAMSELEGRDYRGFATIEELMSKMGTKDEDAVMKELEILSGEGKISLMGEKGNMFIRSL